MTNKEYYKDEISKIGYGDNFGIIDNKVVNCALVDCNDCKFNNSNCDIEIEKWYGEEYVGIESEI